jgi:hypothetical protein
MSPGSDQIPAEQIQGGIFNSEIHELIMLMWNKEEMLHQWKESVAPIQIRAIKLTSNYEVTLLLSTSCKILSNGRSRFDIRQRRKDFSSSLCVQTSSGVHPASSTMDTGGPFPRG